MIKIRNMDDIVLSIFAHQDDETFSAGGVLSIYGKNAYALSITYDEMRIQEFKKACEILGINAVQLHHENIIPNNGESIKRDIVEKIREIKPNHVITHCKFDYHHEHKLLRELVLEAIEWASHTTDSEVEAHQVSHVWTAETTVLIPMPDIFVDISDVNEKRMAAIEVYESQSHKGGDGFYSKFHGARTRLRGIQAGVDHAEAYLKVPTATVGAFKPKKVMKSLLD